jgi:hypothetical protein
LLGRRFAELTEHAAFRRIRLASGDATVEPSRLFFVVPTVEAVAHGCGRERSALTTVVVVILVFILIFVPVVVLVFVLVVPLFLIIVFFFIVVLGPALGLVDEFEIEFVPFLEIEFFDLAIEILDLDHLGILVDGKHAERFFVFDVLVPLAFDGFVISAHGDYLDTGPSGNREGFYFESPL